jgi:hypothetical protein
MKTRILAATVIAAFVLSVTLNTYAQTNTKKVENKGQTTEKTTPKIEKKMTMKKVDKTDMVKKTPVVKKTAKTDAKIDKKTASKTKTLKKKVITPDTK